MKQKTACLGLFSAVAIILGYVESLVPVFAGIPGIKLGLANLGVLFILKKYSFREAALVSVVRLPVIGVMFGNPETTPGGKALKFYASVRLDVRKADTLKDGAEIVGNRTKVKVVKNKLAPPFKTAEFDIVYGKGISQSGCILDLAVAANIVEKSGSWFAYNGEKIGQGRDNAKNYLSANPAVMEEIKNRLLAQIEDKKGKAESENPEG